MIFNALELRNYGLFRNARLDLRPTLGSDGALRNIVLFGGKNGSGKTTIPRGSSAMSLWAAITRPSSSQEGL